MVNLVEKKKKQHYIIIIHVSSSFILYFYFICSKYQNLHGNRIEIIYNMLTIAAVKFFTSFTSFSFSLVYLIQRTQTSITWAIMIRNEITFV